VPVPGPMLYASVFALGCVVGSFLNVCIYRMPRDRSVVSPPSHCPQCGGRLRAVDLVPLVSFLALGRKCRFCGSTIAWRYFTVELITGLVFLAVWRACGPSLQVVPCWVFASVVIAVVFTDLDHMIIPDTLVLAGLAAALLSEGILVARGDVPLLSVSVPGTALAVPRLVAGGLAGLALFVFIRAFSQLLFRREGMGLGDVKLAGAIGAMLGPALALVSFGLAIVAGAVLGVLLRVVRLRRRMEYLPFGPFLAAAALATLLAPELLMGATKELYLRWVGVVAP
jgi:leader peptidase (prepilin peptidase)/N-methyltransferase